MSLSKKTVLKVCLVIFIILCLGYCGKINEDHNKVRYANGPVYVETNDIGCNKYQYYNSEFYKCPKSLGEISHFEERRSCGKSSCINQVPVVSEDNDVSIPSN